MKKVSTYIYLFIFVGLIFFNITASLQSGSSSSGLSYTFTQAVINVINKIIPSISIDFDSFHVIIRKLVGHFGYFGFMAIFGGLTFYGFIQKSRLSVIISGIVGLKISFLSEAMQFMAIDRGPSLIDVLIDFSGYFIMTVIMFFIFNFIENKKKIERKKQENDLT